MLIAFGRKDSGDVADGASGWKAATWASGGLGEAPGIEGDGSDDALPAAGPNPAACEAKLAGVPKVQSRS